MALDRGEDDVRLPASTWAIALSRSAGSMNGLVHWTRTAICAGRPSAVISSSAWSDGGLRRRGVAGDRGRADDHPGAGAASGLGDRGVVGAHDDLGHQPRRPARLDGPDDERPPTHRLEVLERDTLRSAPGRDHGDDPRSTTQGDGVGTVAQGDSSGCVVPRVVRGFVPVPPVIQWRTDREPYRSAQQGRACRAGQPCAAGAPVTLRCAGMAGRDGVAEVSADQRERRDAEGRLVVGVRHQVHARRRRHAAAATRTPARRTRGR